MSTPDGDVLVSGCDTAERFVAVSRNHRGWFGLEPDAIVGRTVRDVLGDEAYGRLAPLVSRALDGEEISSDLELPLPRGARRRVRCTCTPRFHSGTRPDGFLIIFTDLTARTESETAWAAALAQSDAARRLAEDTARTKDEFVATVSHELRTPLNALLGWASILRNEGFDPAASRRAISAIERNARATAILVEDLLDASRMTHGVLHVAHDRVDLVAVVQRAVEAITPTADARRLTVDMRPTIAPLELHGDGLRLQQVFSNVLTNAVRHTPPGGAITITCSSDGQRALVRIVDTGEGIDPQTLVTIFRRFEQGASFVNRRHGGLGLGLAIARHIVELHDGTIRAESEGPGRGATFVIDLPLVAPRAADAAMSRSDIARAALASSGVSIAGVRVLFVTDSSDDMQLVRSTLEEAGAIVTVLDDAAAQAVIEGQEVDVLLCDVDSAPDTVRFLPSFRETHPVPSCALSSYARVGERTRSLAAGFQTVLRKPVDSAELIAAMAGLARLARPLAREDDRDPVS